MQAQLVSIILPVCNQADHVARMVEEYETGLAPLPCSHELLLVLNGCQDRSPEICAELARTYPSLHAVECSERGWGHAVRRGLGEAHGDLICYTNSARTPWRDFERMLHSLAVSP